MLVPGTERLLPVDEIFLVHAVRPRTPSVTVRTVRTEVVVSLVILGGVSV